MQWTDYRAQFPAALNGTYLDAAAIGAPPRQATHAAVTFHRTVSAQGTRALPWILDGADRARARTAALLGVAPADVGFTDCTSTSMNWLAMLAAQDRGPRSQVVLLRGEFPSSTLPWLHHGFEPVWVDPEPAGHYDPERILAAAGPRVRAVVTSLVQYRTGARTDAAALAAPLAERGIWHVVNATQGAGVVPFDAARHTAVTVTALKWLCAGFGCGILYLSPQLRPTTSRGRWPLAGWIAQEDFMSMQNDALNPRRDASAVELGATDMARLHALEQSVAVLQAAGIPAVGQRIRGLTRRLMDGLAARGAPILTPDDDAHRAGIVTATRGDADAWHAAALAAGIAQSPRGDGAIRFSVHAYNDEDDIDRALSAWDGRF